MNPAALVTPPYRPELERCGLPCETADPYVTSFTKHCRIVPRQRAAAPGHVAFPEKRAA